MLFQITGISFNSNGSALAASYSADSIYLFDVRRSEAFGSEYGEPRLRLKGHCNVRTVKEVAWFGSQSEYVVSGSDDGRIFFWDTSGKIVHLLDHADSEASHTA